MKHIMIVAQGQGFLVSSFQSHLSGMNYEVSFVEADVAAISKVTAAVDAVIVYGDEELFEHQKALVYLADRVTEVVYGIPVKVKDTSE